MLLYQELTNRILKACYTVHNELGCGFLEKVYQEALEVQLSEMDIPFEREKKLNIVYKGHILEKEYYADFVCYNKIIVELKCVSSLINAHKGQVINYLKATKNKVGLLINFGGSSLKWERLTNLKDSEER